MRWRVAAIWLELLFIAGWLIADGLAGWPWTRLDVSDLVHGDRPWIILSAFLLHAGSLVALALARPASKWPLLVSALGMTLVTFFATDLPGQDTIAGTVHVIGAGLAFGGIAVAAWIARRDLPLVPLALIVVLNTILVAGFAQEGAGVFPVIERLQVLLNGAWIINAALSSDR